ncbi:unnamed protein product, partial [Symbiodinium necroappetens]
AHEPDVILIQENANVSRNEFGHEALPQMLRSLQEQDYSILQEGEFVTVVWDRSREAFPIALPRLSRMKGKVHAVRVPALNAVILNVHLTFDGYGTKESKQTRKDLEAIVAICKEQYRGTSIILAGDTNRVPQEDRLDGAAEVIEQLIDGLGILYMPPGPTNVRYNCDKDTTEYTYADFVADLTVRQIAMQEVVKVQDAASLVHSYVLVTCYPVIPLCQLTLAAAPCPPMSAPAGPHFPVDPVLKVGIPAITSALPNTGTGLPTCLSCSDVGSWALGIWCPAGPDTSAQGSAPNLGVRARLWRSDVAIVQLLSPRLLTLAVAAPMSPVPEDYSVVAVDSTPDGEAEGPRLLDAPKPEVQAGSFRDFCGDHGVDLVISGLRK